MSLLVEPEEHVSVRLVIRERVPQQGSEIALLTANELTGDSLLAAVASFNNLEKCESLQAQCETLSAELRRTRWHARRLQADKASAEATAAAATAERDCALDDLANASAFSPPSEDAVAAIGQPTSVSDSTAVAAGAEGGSVAKELAQLEAEYQRLQATLQRAREEMEEAHTKSGRLEAELAGQRRETERLAKSAAELIQVRPRVWLEWRMCLLTTVSRRLLGNGKSQCRSLLKSVPCH